MGTLPKFAMGVNGLEAEIPPPSVPVHESDIIDHISANPQVFYKHRQRNEPELTESEKKSILREVLNNSHCTFLYRFGKYMRNEHLQYFEQDEQTLAYSPDERYDIDILLTRIRNLLNGGCTIQVRNRRFTALQRMCEEGTYFSETEMMQRDPLLYHEMVGQYMTEQEKYARDATTSEPRTVVGILLNQIDKHKAEKDLQQQREEEAAQQQQQQELDGEPSRPNSPGFPRAQWGNFDEEEEARVAALKRTNEQKRWHAIPASQTLTAGERDLLREEFVANMYERFISGEEKEFDYTLIDNSDAYDDLETMNRDAEDKYFSVVDETLEGRIDGHDEDYPMHVEKAGDESEDELDIYMRHLNQHLEQQEKIAAEANRYAVRDPYCEYDSDD